MASNLSYLYFCLIDLLSSFSSPSSGRRRLAKHSICHAAGAGKDFKPISSNYHIQSLENGSLLIKDVQKSDEGRYLCDASNGVGPDLSAITHFRVHIRPYFKSGFQVNRVVKGGSVALQCAVHGDKPITVRWAKDGIDITLIKTDK